MLGLIIFISVPIVIMIIIGILGIRDGLKNGFPKSSGDDDDMFEKDDTRYNPIYSGFPCNIWHDDNDNDNE